MNPTPPDAAALRAKLDTIGDLTVGVEEELLLLDPTSLDLAPVAREVVERLDDEETFKLEMPAAQLEIVTPPRGSVAQAVADLAAGRRALARAAEGVAFPAGASVHPFAGTEAVLNRGERYERILDEYGPIARRQVVGALQVHVAIRGADRALAVYNGLRDLLPEMAALAAAAPWYGGRDSGMASVRPLVSQLLPRQGLPPAIASWEEFAAGMAWGVRSGTVPDSGSWWWELRPHVVHGTLEIRVPDTQATLADTAGVVAFAHCLAAWLAARHDDGERFEPAPGWRIGENRWSACRHGLAGVMTDLRSGESQATDERLAVLIDDVAPFAAHLGCAAELEEARRLVSDGGGAAAQRRAGETGGAEAVARTLADRFLDGT